MTSPGPGSAPALPARKALSEARVTRTFPEFFDHLKRIGWYPLTCVDVGAANGTPSIYRAFPEALHIAYEPLPDFIPDLEKCLEPFRHEIHVRALLEEPGEGHLLRHSDLFGSSLMHRQDKSNERVVEVEVSTLDEDLAARKLSGPILLKTDCQGADLPILKGGKKFLSRCDVVIVEVSMYRFWGAHQADFWEVVSFMNRRGFAVYDFLGGLFRPSDGALGQIDVVFVKKEGPLRAKHNW
jgi:FkbM family methyltransferase